MKTGSINHLAITVNDLNESIFFYKPFLELLGYELKESFPNDSSNPDSYFGCCLFGSDTVGTWINLWQKSPESKSGFWRYNVGLHHIAFHVETYNDLEVIYEWVRKNEFCKILDSPALYPEYAENYKSFYFTECNGIKMEVVSFGRC